MNWKRQTGNLSPSSVFTERSVKAAFLALTAVGFAVGCGTAFVSSRLSARELVWPYDRIFYDNLEHRSILFALVAAGIFLVLSFLRKTWPYQLFVPIAAIGYAYARQINLFLAPDELILTLGPISLGINWVGFISMAIPSAILLYSANARSARKRIVSIAVFIFFWCFGGLLGLLATGLAAIG